jgi:NH3-dependent NAD+ synthetase
MSLKQIIQESMDRNPLGVKEALEAELQERVRLALEAKMSEPEDEDEDDMDESFDLSDLTLEELEDFMMSEDFDQLDEISKKTLRSYVKKNMDSGAEPPTRLTPLRDVERRKAEYQKRLKGFGKATDKLTGRARVNATDRLAK